MNQLNKSGYVSPALALGAILAGGMAATLGMQFLKVIIDAAYPYYADRYSQPVFEARVLIVFFKSFAAATVFILAFYFAMSSFRERKRATRSHPSQLELLIVGILVIAINWVRTRWFAIRLHDERAADRRMLRIDAEHDPKCWVIIVPGTWSGSWSITAWRGLVEHIAALVPRTAVFYWVWPSENLFERRSAESELLSVEINNMRTRFGREGLVIGHSHGGTIAVDACSRLPERTARLITVGTPFFTIAARPSGAGRIHWNVQAVLGLAPTSILLFFFFFNRAFVNVVGDMLHLTSGTIATFWLSALVDVGIIAAVLLASLLLIFGASPSPQDVSSLSRTTARTPLDITVITVLRDPIFVAAGHISAWYSMLTSFRREFREGAVLMLRSWLWLPFVFLLPAVPAVIFLGVEPLIHAFPAVGEVLDALMVDKLSVALFRDTATILPTLGIVTCCLLARRQLPMIEGIGRGYVLCVSALPAALWGWTLGALLGLSKDAAAQFDVAWSEVPDHFGHRIRTRKLSAIDDAGLSWTQSVAAYINPHSAIIHQKQLYAHVVSEIGQLLMPVE